MGVRLTVKMRGEEGGAEKPQVVLLDDDIIMLGRDQGCQVVLAQQAVSRNHARISRDGSLFFVEDLGSSFGTQINGQKLPKGEKRLLRNGDTIVIAQFDVQFDRVADVSNEESGKTMFVSRKVVKDVMKGLAAGGEQPYFRVMNGPREGQRIEISDAQEYVIGRDEGSADIVLKDDLVSRKHVKVRRDWSGTHLEDLGSRNGIKVNKKKLRRADLKDRDEVEIGGVRLLYIDPAEVRETPLVLPSLSGEDSEGTLSIKADEEAVPPPEEKSEPVEEQPKSEPNPTSEAPPSGENEIQPSPGTTGDNGASEADQPGDQPADGAANTGEDPSDFAPVENTNPRGDAIKVPLIDFSNKQTLIVLGVVGAMLLTAIVLFVLLIVGA